VHILDMNIMVMRIASQIAGRQITAPWHGARYGNVSEKHK
jgi:hypothetical protein